MLVVLEGKDLEGKTYTVSLEGENLSRKIAMKKISFNLDKCTTCGECLGLCDALSIYKVGFVEHGDCDLCGECVDVCDAGALQIKEEEKGRADLPTVSNIIQQGLGLGIKIGKSNELTFML